MRLACAAGPRRTPTDAAVHARGAGRRDRARYWRRRKPGEHLQRLAPALLADSRGLAREVRTAKPELADRIRRKFAIKNTTGYSLNALVDYEDPFDILEHLMIGSEGTLGFISEITYRTVPDHAHKACALLFFETLVEACRAL